MSWDNLEADVLEEFCEAGATRPRQQEWLDGVSCLRASDAEYKRAWRSANQTRCLEVRRRWVAANRDKDRERQRRYWAAHKAEPGFLERHRENWRRWVAKKKATP